MDNNNEIWKDIQGYEGKYQVSNYGNVKSLDRVVVGKNGKLRKIKGKSIVQQMQSRGYLSVCLWKDNKGNNKYVHRLVAEAFLIKIDGKTVVNHKDGNKRNNFVCNLEWVTYSQNNIHALENGLRHSNKNNKRMSKAVECYSLDGKFVKRFPSMREAEREMGLANGTVHMAIKKVGNIQGIFGN